MTVLSGEPVIKPEDFLPESRNVSNSEVTAFLSCKRQYDFAFIEAIEPKEEQKHLTRGTVGHGQLEHYIKARLNSSNHEQALKAADAYLVQVMAEGSASVDTIGEAKFLFKRYMSYNHGWPEWRLLGAEERVDLKLTDTLNIAIRYDLMVEELSTGRHLMGDWKFTYDFWQSWKHALNPQMPKYLSVMRANNWKVDGGFVIEIRTRSLGKDKASDPKNLWRYTPYQPILPQMSAMMKQHIMVSQEIEKHRALDETYRKEYVSQPTLNQYGACSFCNFKDLCDSMNKGKKDLTVDIREMFKPSTYGYNKQTEEVGF